MVIQNIVVWSIGIFIFGVAVGIALGYVLRRYAKQRVKNKNG
jgi:uncharacterized membrane-anchored protein YhcB (DUF1043 family)